MFCCLCLASWMTSMKTTWMKQPTTKNIWRSIKVIINNITNIYQNSFMKICPLTILLWVFSVRHRLPNNCDKVYSRIVGSIWKEYETRKQNFLHLRPYLNPLNLEKLYTKLPKYALDLRMNIKRTLIITNKLTSFKFIFKDLIFFLMICNIFLNILKHILR